MRIATGCIGHETNTFSSVATGLDHFKNENFHVGDEVIAAFVIYQTTTGPLLFASKFVSFFVLWARRSARRRFLARRQVVPFLSARQCDGLGHVVGRGRGLNNNGSLHCGV